MVEAILITFLIIISSVWILFKRRRNQSRYSVPPRITLKGKISNTLLSPFSRYPRVFDLVFNTSWFIFGHATLPDKPNIFKSLELDDLQNQAVRACGGIDDFGDDWYERAFRRVIERVNSASYSPIGKAAVHNFLTRRLMTRLRFNKELSLESNRGWDRIRVRRPVFVMGLPRTGTTYLHRLLSLDPACRAPLTWELYDPTPRIRAGDNFLSKDERLRVEYIDRATRALLAVTPHLLDCHEMGANLPEECMLAMGMDLPVLFSTFHLLIAKPYDHFEWDGTVVYQNYAKFLQLLQFQAETNKISSKSNKRWVLKAPIHLGLIKYLYKGFPDAHIVWTHRDPREAVASLASFLRSSLVSCFTFKYMFCINSFSVLNSEIHKDFHEGSSSIHLDELGTDAYHFSQWILQKADTFLSDPDNSSCNRSHVQYRKLVDDPINVVRLLYNEFGYDFTSEYECILKTHLKVEHEKREKSCHGHKYTLDEYDLDEEIIAKDMKWYTDKYLL